MNPSRIRLGDESFLIFPSDAKMEKCEAFLKYKDDVLVFITPSLKEDFKIEAYKNSKPLLEYYSSAVSAAAYLTEKMGLPLPDMSFEAPNGKIEIINTGSGVFTAQAEKCKLLFSKFEEVRGCAIEYFDFSFLKKFRVLLAKNQSSFSLDALREFSFLGGNTACAIALFTDEGTELVYSPFAEEFTSLLPSLFRSYIFRETKRREMLCVGEIGFDFSFADVTLTARPAIT
jgi:hypothetical protein